MLDSINPRAGPDSGLTRVTVRATGIENLFESFPEPKCRFGANNMVVDATYVKCTKSIPGFYDKEKGGKMKDSVCISCNNSPKSAVDEVVSFSVSLTGDFEDVTSSVPYRYYKQARVSAIFPRYGPKDGGTTVFFWGENFLNLGDNFKCNFGTKAVEAHLLEGSSTRGYCYAPFSDVVNNKMPFSISINKQ